MADLPRAKGYHYPVTVGWLTTIAVIALIIYLGGF